MTDAVDPADLARLRSRSVWGDGATDAAADPDRASRRAECDATRAGHLEVVVEPDEVPRCAHCGDALSPDALRRAGIKGRRS